MEDRAAEMLISMVGKGTEMTVKIAAASSRALLKLAAFLKALWEKQTPRGKVNMMKLLKDGTPLSSLFMQKDQYEQFRKIARKNGITYCIERKTKTDLYMVTMKTSDVARYNTIFEFYNMSAEELRRDAAEKPKDTYENDYTSVNDEKDVKIEDVDKDEIAMYDMDEQNERENFDLEKEIERNKMTKEEYEKRKEEILEKNDSVDVEKWDKESGRTPHMFLVADDELIAEAQKEIRAEEFGEAKAVSKLREGKVTEIEIPKVDIKVQEVEITSL